MLILLPCILRIAVNCFYDRRAEFTQLALVPKKVAQAATRKAKAWRSWYVEGAGTWWNDGAPTIGSCTAVDDATAAYKVEIDYLAQWIRENCVTTDAKAKTPSTQLFAAFREWEKVNVPYAVRVKTATEFGTSLGKLNYVKDTHGNRLGVTLKGYDANSF